MNFGLMATRAEARRLDIRNMNIAERSAWAFRVERIGNPYWPYKEEHSEIETHTPEPEFVKRQWDIVTQLQLDNAHLRKQWYEHLKEDREYRANANKESDDYL